MFVIDASVTLSWCFPDEATDSTEKLLKQMSAGSQAVVPAHWPVEVLNGLIKAKKRGRITNTAIQRFVNDIASFKITIEHQLNIGYFEELIALAEKHNLTSYDAAHLDLAKREALSLATLDDALKKAASAEGVSLL